MKILLVNCPNRESEPPRHYPYGVALLTAVLRDAGHRVGVFDGNFATLDQLTGLLRSTRFDIIGLSGLVTTFAYQRDVLRAIRREAENSLLISGGGLASSVGCELLGLLPELDACFLGEGEESLLDLASGGGHVERVAKGMAYRQGSAIVDRGFAPPIEDLDALPPPDLGAWEVERYFANLSFPLTPNITQAVRRGNVLTSRGCPFACDFCFNALGRRRARFRSPEGVIEEIGELVGKHGIDFISFMDESFMANRRMVEAICEGILTNGWAIRWGVAARSTSVDREHLRLMSRAGCDYIYFGFDSGSPATLERMGKGMTVDDNFEAFKTAVEERIYPVPNIIIGYDNEAEENIAENYAFLRRLIRYGRSLTGSDERACFERGFNNFGAIYFATPYPGTELYRRATPRLPPLVDLLEAISGKDAYEFAVNVSLMPDAVLIRHQHEMETFVRSFRL